MAMLRESSTRTAMMFCCGFNSATVIAGCQSSTSTSVARANSRNQMTPARQLRTGAAACGKRARISSARPTAVASTRKNNTHFGQPPSRTNSPLEKIDDGYLKRS